MTRVPFQVLVFPYRFPPGGGVEYAVFKRADLGFWQGVSGGGEDAETPFEAAKREALEEGGIPPESRYMALDATATIPVVDITGDLRWGNSVLVVPEHCFGVDVTALRIKLSQEHTEFRWVGCDEARSLVKHDSNRTALWELNERLRRLTPQGPG